MSSSGWVEVGFGEVGDIASTDHKQTGEDEIGQQHGIKIHKGNGSSITSFNFLRSGKV